MPELTRSELTESQQEPQVLALHKEADQCLAELERCGQSRQRQRAVASTASETRSETTGFTQQGTPIIVKALLLAERTSQGVGARSAARENMNAGIDAAQVDEPAPRRTQG